MRWFITTLVLVMTLGCALVATPTPVPPTTPAATLQVVTPTPPPPTQAPPSTEEPPTPPPQPTPTPLTALNDGTFSTGQVSLGYSTLLLSGFEARIEEEFITEPGPEFCSPRHILLRPLGYPSPANALHSPQIRIYPVARYVELLPWAEEQVEALRTLLATRPPLSPAPDNLPFLPPFNAAQMFATQARYLDFGNGSGIRYLTQYGQAIYPINNSDLFYTYQGLSADGTYYISAIFPVAHPLLPAEGNTPPGGDWNAFYDQFASYVADLSTALDVQPDAAFVPNLTLLDSMMASLTVQPGTP